eukprot:TRINITY_DN52694_c2_g2_i3.p1 TRINITY_DN52694_c2_g2~~TRINITY_DN52694_c2_g2_i3.p1  ORF type:complete len:242 (-),score=31.29 TRINITY_DN52694_c2_g2_i3:494-1219(-)
MIYEVSFLLVKDGDPQGDPSWVRQLAQFQMPRAPEERFRTWWLHSWPYTWVCFPYSDDPTARKHRMMIVVAEIIMTAVMSEAYMSILGVQLPVAEVNEVLSNETIDPYEVSGTQVLVVAAIAYIVNLSLRHILSAVMRGSCRQAVSTTGTAVRYAGMAFVVLVIIGVALVPLIIIMSERTCEAVWVVLQTCLFAEISRGLLGSLAGALLEYLLLWRFGRRSDQEQDTPEDRLQASELRLVS